MRYSPPFLFPAIGVFLAISIGCGGGTGAKASAGKGSPDFSISTASSSQTVTAGSSTTYTVQVTGSNGFTGTVALTVSGLPSGATGSFSPINASGASTLTVTTTSSTPAGTSTLTVTGASGNLSHSITVTLVVSTSAPQPDFNLAVAPSTQIVTVGSSASYTLTATPLSGFNGTIFFSAGNLPAGVTATFNPSSLNGSGSSTVTVATTSGTQAGSYTITLTGTSVSLTHSVSANLTVNVVSSGSIKTVFIILMENHNWVSIKDPTQAPYINNTLLAMGAHAEQYFNPPGIHPSEPNYLWLEAGDNFGILDDADPSTNHQSTTMHLVTLLKNANISWKAYQEDIDGKSCPLTSVNQYAPKHNPFVFFDDVTNTNDPNSAFCIAHIRPFTELATDLNTNNVASYNFITPNLCNDMHDCSIATGDTWLANNVSTILNSAAYQQGGAIFITWDEGEGGDGPIGMIVLSPKAKVGYQNALRYTHGSTLRTFQEIFNVTPLLGDAAKQLDLSDLFASFP